MKNFLIRALGASLTMMLFSACSGDESAQTESDNGDMGSVIGSDYKDEVNISYCKMRYLRADETRTIPEIFTGEEYTYGQLTLRSQPTKRAGMYFFVMMDYGPDDISLASQIVISLDSTDNPRTRTFTFVVPETHSVLREMRLGITGSDWPNPKAAVNAWKIEIKSPSGKTICEKQSWLWSLKGAQRKEMSTPSVSLE